MLKTTCIIPADDTIPQHTEGALIARIYPVPYYAVGAAFSFRSTMRKGGMATVALFLDDEPDAVAMVGTLHDKEGREIQSHRAQYLFGDKRPSLVTLRAGVGDGIGQIELTEFVLL